MGPRPADPASTPGKEQADGGKRPARSAWRGGAMNGEGKADMAEGGGGGLAGTHGDILGGKHQDKLLSADNPTSFFFFSFAPVLVFTNFFCWHLKAER